MRERSAPPPFRILELAAGDEFQVTAVGAARVEYRVCFGEAVDHVRNAIEVRDEKIEGLRERLQRSEAELAQALTELEAAARR